MGGAPGITPGTVGRMPERSMSERTKPRVSSRSSDGSGSWGSRAAAAARTSSSPIRSSRARISASGRWSRCRRLINRSRARWPSLYRVEGPADSGDGNSPWAT